MAGSVRVIANGGGNGRYGLSVRAEYWAVWLAVKSAVVWAWRHPRGFGLLVLTALVWAWTGTLLLAVLLTLTVTGAVLAVQQHDRTFTVTHALRGRRVVKYASDPVWRAVSLADSVALLGLFGPLHVPFFYSLAVLFGAAHTVYLMQTRPAGNGQGTHWYDHNELQRVLHAAGLIRKDADGHLPGLRWLGRTQHLDSEVRVTFRAPDAGTHKEYATRQMKLASAMHVDPARLEVLPGKEAGAVTLALLDERDRQPRPSTYAEAERCAWATEKVRLGTNARGQAVTAMTRGRHTKVIGETGSGKTTLARTFVAGAILDPTVQVWCISGKDDADDWRPLRKVCEPGRYVAGTRGSALTAYRDLLRALDTISEERADAGRNVADIVLVVDEWARIRKAAMRHDPKLAAELDNLMADLGSSSRSRNIQIVALFQRGTTKYLDAELNANMTQGLCGTTVDADEVRYAFGRTSPVLPQRSEADDGWREFLIARKEDAQPELFLAEVLTDEQFVAVCERGAALRSKQRVNPEPTLTAEPVDPLRDAVLNVVRAGDLGGMQPSAVFAALPESVRPATDARLGRELKAWSEPGGPLEARWAGSRKVYRVRQEALGATPATNGRYPLTKGTNGPSHAQNGAPDAVPSELQAVP